MWSFRILYNLISENFILFSFSSKLLKGTSTHYIFGQDIRKWDMNLNFLTLVNQHPPYGIFVVMQFQKWQLAYLFCPNYETNHWLTALDRNGLRVCSWWHRHQLSRTPLHCFCSISIINLILPILILLSWIYSPTLLENLKLHNEALLLILKGKISRFFLWWRSDSFYWSFKTPDDVMLPTQYIFC